jgi:hypothetical protein
LCNKINFNNIIIKWIPSHAEIVGNDKADELAKLGTKINDTLQYKLQNKDFDRIIKNKEINTWNEWFFETSFEKGKYYYDIVPEIQRDPWYKTIKINNVNTKIINRLLAGHTYTKKWLKIMKLEPSNLCDTCNVIEDADHLIDDCNKFKHNRDLPKYKTLKEKKLKGILRENSLEGLNCLIDFIKLSEIKI